MNFRDFLKENTVLLDGAMGTMLQSAGLKGGQLPELYNITHAETVRDIHKQYVLAGSDVVSANTFGANALKLKDSGYTVEQIITAALQNAAASGAKYVALDLGPTGQLLEPYGDVSADEIKAVYRQSILAGAAAGADLILFETFADLNEMCAAVAAAKECCGLPVICSFSYESVGRTFMGVSPAGAAGELETLGIDGIGANCSLGPAALLPVVKEILASTRLPVMIQANAGLPQMRDGETVYDIAAGEYAQYAVQMCGMGVRLLGGCCGTTPQHIAAIKEILQK